MSYQPPTQSPQGSAGHKPYGNFQGETGFQPQSPTYDGSSGAHYPPQKAVHYSSLKVAHYSSQKAVYSSSPNDYGGVGAESVSSAYPNMNTAEYDGADGNYEAMQDSNQEMPYGWGGGPGSFPREMPYGMGLKRKRTRPEMDMNSGGLEYGGPPGRKKIKKTTKGPITPKNPVSLLNELRPGLEYDIVPFTQEGRTPDPRFKASVTIDGDTFCGESTSKKDAKQICAEIALNHFINSPSSKLYQQLVAKVTDYPGQEVPAEKLSNLFYSVRNKKTQAESSVNSHGATVKVEPDETAQVITNGNKPESLGKGAEPTLPPMSPSKKKKKKDTKNILDGWRPDPDSNPTMILNQVNGPQEWECVSDVLVGNTKEFTMRIVIGSQAFEGKASNKKNAKAAAARQALKSLYSIELAGGGDGVVEVKDMTAEETVDVKAQEEKSAQASAKNAQEKNPTQLLNEMMGASVRFEAMSETGPAHARQFTIKVEIKGQTFIGTGYSKKVAKAAAAKEALAGLFNITNIASFSKTSGRSAKVPPIPQHLMAPQDLADHIGKLVNQKFSEMIEGEDTYSRRKVLAGMVMTTGTSLQDTSIICVSTGTKCISGEHMSTEGKALNDCHAEIISRRCLVHFLLTKLEEAVDNGFTKDSIYERTEDGKKFRVKPNVQFHLYINTSPCGDARIFSPHEASSEEDSADRHPNRKARGQLRTKIESGEGTIPVKSNTGVQTWDGVMEGQRLLTMSCSDKIAKWNVVGLQGSLLSIFLEPVYLQTIILGSLFHPQHMFRAMCGRIENSLESLPLNFKMRKPSMNVISSPESRQPGKAPNYSLSWITGFPDKEVINAVTGKDEAGNPSKICKHGLFTKWMLLADKVKDITGFKLPSPVNYRDIKAAAQDYQSAKELMFSAFQKCDLGTWIKKPMEQDQFTIDNPTAS